MKNIKNLTVQQWIPIDKIYNDGIIKLKENVDKAYDLLKISDANGNDMIYDRIDTEKIISWWE